MQSKGKGGKLVPCKTQEEALKVREELSKAAETFLTDHVRGKDGAQCLILAGAATDDGMAAVNAGYSTGMNRVQLLISAVESLDPQEFMMFTMGIMAMQSKGKGKGGSGISGLPF